MSTGIVKQELKSLMEMIQEQQQLVLSYEGKIPQIELDILMNNIRKAYELFLTLNKTDKSEVPVAPPVQEPVEYKHPDDLIAEVATAEPEIEVPTIEPPAPIISEAAPVKIESTDNGRPHVQPEIFLASVDVPVVEEKNEVITEAVLPTAAMAKERTREYVKSTAKAATASLFDDAPTIAGQFQNATTVRDKIAGTKEDKSIAEKLQQDPLTDLKKSIGINEKFAFINELFDGNLEGYNAAIDKLNNCGSLDAALGVLSSQLADTYNWTDDGTRFQQLRNLIVRRFSA